MRMTIVGVLCLAAVCLVPVAAQQKLDRKQIPPAGPAPALRVPAWTTSKLADGAEFVVSERHGLPLVSFSITFVGGANQYEPDGKRGLAAMTAAMMREGTKTRSGEQLAVDLQMLGANVGVSVDDESGAMSFTSTAEQFPATLAIMTDMLVNSTFPADALDRLRAQRLIALTRANAQPRSIANRVFGRTLYGAAHPYGQEADEASIKAITRDDVVSFHQHVLQAGPRRHHRRRRRGRREAEAGRREGARRMAGRWRETGIHLSRAAGRASDHHLPGRQARRRAVHVCHRQSRTRRARRRTTPRFR